MLVIDAIHEAVNNTVKHAGGKNVFITIAGGSCTILNDGRPPQQEIAEAGGLANLRAAVQQAGGTMEVVSRPRLMIRIGLPKEAE
jgi:signal transduction histidine kinase